MNCVFLLLLSPTPLPLPDVKRHDIPTPPWEIRVPSKASSAKKKLDPPTAKSAPAVLVNNKSTASSPYAPERPAIEPKATPAEELLVNGHLKKRKNRPIAPWESPFAPSDRAPAQFPPGMFGNLNEPGTQPPSDSFQQALASAPEGGTQSEASFAPGFFGDFVGGCVLTDTVTFAEDAGNGLPGFCPRLVCAPSPSQAGGYKASENESPRPVDRFFYNFTFYGNIDVTTDLSPDAPDLQLSRHVLGFEKTFLNGDASIGLRLPFIRYGGDVGYEAGVVADMIVVTKYAFRNNRQNGNVVSGGLVMSLPTGGAPVFFDSLTGLRNLRQNRLFPVIFQPWFGYVFNPTRRLYFHGFHSVAVPTLVREASVVSNDLGVGYWLYRNPNDNILLAAIPTVEVHVNTPLNNRPPGDPSGGTQTVLVDSVTVTAGVNFILPGSIVGAAVGIPIVGQAQIEALATWQLRF